MVWVSSNAAYYTPPPSIACIVNAGAGGRTRIARWGFLSFLIWHLPYVRLAPAGVATAAERLRSDGDRWVMVTTHH